MAGTRAALGVSESYYEWMADANGGKCWVCDGEEPCGRRLAVDHDHATGQVRGLLCTSCNRRLGPKSTEDWLTRAAAYLRRSNQEFGDDCGAINCDGLGLICWADGKRDGMYVMVCNRCGRRWRCSFKVDGIPYTWLMGGIQRIRTRP